jgi:glycerol kinase
MKKCASKNGSKCASFAENSNEPIFFPRFFDLNPSILPKLKSSSEIYGYVKEGILEGIPIASVRESNEDP